MLYVYDCEVFAKDWLVVVHKIGGDQSVEVVHNDGLALSKIFSRSNAVFIGFNSKHYDQWIVKAACTGADVDEIKSINDFIINGYNGWEHPYFHQNERFDYSDCDIRDDMQVGLSLKAIEGHLGMEIEESSVPFDIDRPLTSGELEETIFYCKHDVEATIELVKVRKDYLDTKMQLAVEAGLSREKGLTLTNAKLTAAYLHASKFRPENGEWGHYQYPENLDKKYVPEKALAFVEELRLLPVDELEKGEHLLDFEIGGCPMRMGIGGGHGAAKFYREDATVERVIVNYDVASLYPSVMINCGYTSRAIPDPSLFKAVYDERIEAKHNGDKAKASVLKLVLNTTYGAMINGYNDLFDPLMGRAVCLSGQLYMYELAQHYVDAIPDIRIIQLNTDGIMVSLSPRYYAELQGINAEWMERTGFCLEEDRISRIVQKDVNNYVMVKNDGSVKVKGAWLSRGISGGGAWSINEAQTAVADAITEYFAHDIPVEETILKHKDLLDFQTIAKASTKYSKVFWMVDGEEREVNKCNRIYATKDVRYGSLRKIKKDTNNSEKMADVPEHCLIDNNNELTIADIDVGYYIALAMKKIEAFMEGEDMEENQTGEKSERVEKAVRKPAVRAAAPVPNVYQRLAAARMDFLNRNVPKTGKNMFLEFTYFELNDIVPIATEIFSNHGLLQITNIKKAKAVVVNVEDPSEVIKFQLPEDVPMPVIINKEGKDITNPLQALGMKETYVRRYLWMLMLDIVENDITDATLGSTGDSAKPSAAPKPKLPPTPIERKDAVKTITAPDGAATKTQLSSLARALKKLKGLDGTEETGSWITTIAIKAKSEKLTKEECERLLIETGERIKEAEAA